jgi:hypothetical protein
MSTSVETNFRLSVLGSVLKEYILCQRGQTLHILLLEAKWQPWLSELKHGNILPSGSKMKKRQLNATKTIYYVLLHLHVFSTVWYYVDYKSYLDF